MEEDGLDDSSSIKVTTLLVCWTTLLLCWTTLLFIMLNIRFKIRVGTFGQSFGPPSLLLGQCPKFNQFSIWQPSLRPLLFPKSANPLKTSQIPYNLINWPQRTIYFTNSVDLPSSLCTFPSKLPFISPPGVAEMFYPRGEEANRAVCQSRRCLDLHLP